MRKKERGTPTTLRQNSSQATDEAEHYDADDEGDGEDSDDESSSNTGYNLRTNRG